VLLNDIEAHLNSFGAWTQDGVTYTVRRNYTPDTPDPVISLEEFPAGKAIFAMGPSLRSPVRERAGLMVVVRGPQKDATNARAMAEQVHLKLDGLKAVLSTRRYTVFAMHSPIRREQDRNARWEYETNYVVLKERG
jgi:hypothetical protein